MHRHSSLAASLALLVFPCAALAQNWGDLQGQFVFKGTPPTPQKIVVDKDPAFCGKHGLVTETIVVNKDNKGLANVVVYLLPAPGKKVQAHPDYEKTAKDQVVLDNQNCRFSPHVAALRTTQTLVLGNKDPVGHNVKADFFNNTAFNVLIPAGGKLEKTLTAAETMPSKVECSIHPWMGGYLLVTEHPYAAVSDADGKFTIKNLPAGDHTFIVWHETGYITSGTVGGKATTWARGRAKFSIKPGVNDLGKIEVAPKPR